MCIVCLGPSHSKAFQILKNSLLFGHTFAASLQYLLWWQEFLMLLKKAMLFCIAAKPMIIINNYFRTTYKVPYHNRVISRALNTTINIYRSQQLQFTGVHHAGKPILLENPEEKRCRDVIHSVLIVFLVSIAVCKRLSIRYMYLRSRDAHMEGSGVGEA